VGFVPFTVVVSVSALFAGSGSASAAETSAELVSVPLEVGRTWMVTVAEPPLAIDPKEQVTTPPAWEQVPWEGVAEMNWTFGGSWSSTVTPVASEGPPLVTVRV
jgi:hypothetical protein